MIFVNGKLRHYRDMKHPWRSLPERTMFTNESIRITPPDYYGRGCYGFNHAPRLLFFWSRLFQTVVSQAATYMLTGKFHNQHCAIYKCEGGCALPGVNELVLGDKCCYFDFCSGSEEDLAKEQKCADLITYIVLNWKPNDPINSMLTAAAAFIKVDVSKLEKAVEKSNNGGPFGGNALSDFFNWNPFSDPPADRVYEKWCYINFNGKTGEEVDQMYADQDLGKSLRERINKAIRERHGDSFYTLAMCCSPSRKEDSLRFWVNTGRSTQIDGWKTQEELEAFINSGEKIADTARW